MRPAFLAMAMAGCHCSEPSVWAQTTVPYGTPCEGDCQPLTSIDAHGAKLDLVYNPAVDDPIAQWGDCLASVMTCVDGGGAIVTCVAASDCPPECRDRFARDVATATDDPARLAVWQAVFVDDGAPCVPEAP